MKRNFRAGISLIELLVALAIISAVLSQLLLSQYRITAQLNMSLRSYTNWLRTSQPDSDDATCIESDISEDNQALICSSKSSGQLLRIFITK